VWDIGEGSDNGLAGEAEVIPLTPRIVQSPAIFIVTKKDRFWSTTHFQRITDGANALDEKRPLLDSPFAAEERACSLDGRIVEAGDDRI
jgi:hypothetical protein